MAMARVLIERTRAARIEQAELEQIGEQLRSVASIGHPVEVIRVMDIGPVRPGTTVEQAHRTWKPEYVGELRGFPGFPLQPVALACPDGVDLVEVDLVSEAAGGMGTQFGYKGTFVSVLMHLTGEVWDMRVDGAW